MVATTSIAIVNLGLVLYKVFVEVVKDAAKLVALLVVIMQFQTVRTFKN